MESSFRNPVRRILLRVGLSGLASFLLLPLVVAPGRARAQDGSADEASASLKKASLVFSVQGIAPVKPTRFYLRVELWADGNGHDAVQADYQQHLTAVLATLRAAGLNPGNASAPVTMHHVGENAYVVVSSPEASNAPSKDLRVSGQFGFSVATTAQARTALTALRATGAQGTATLGYSVADEEAAHLAALKAAVGQAKARVQVLGEAAKPKEFELVFLKEGDFQVADVSTRIDLQDTTPLRLLDTINAQSNITLFYGFKPIAPAVPTNVAVAPKAGAAKANPEP